MSQHNITVSTPPPASPDYMAARRGVAFFVRADRGYVVVSGADRLSFLHALLTNDIARLGAGAGCYAALLTPNGRMVTDVWVHELGDATLLRLGVESAPTLLARLDALVFSEDVQLGDVTTAFRGVSIVGPGAHALMGTMLGRPVDLELHGAQRVGSDSGVAIIVRSDDLGVDGYELLVEPGRAAAFFGELESRGAVSLDAATAEVLRVEGGVPKFHQDMDENVIPLEAGIEDRAISLTKGCYVGQEVIIRVLHRGHGRVARRLVGLTCEGPNVPAPGQDVRDGATIVGRITSSARSPAVGRSIALAYVQREVAESGRRVTIAGVTGEKPDAVTGVPAADIAAVVAPLPFVPSEDRTSTSDPRS